jgi:hypothetical protein
MKAWDTNLMLLPLVQQQALIKLQGCWTPDSQQLVCNVVCLIPMHPLLFLTNTICIPQPHPQTWKMRYLCLPSATSSLAHQNHGLSGKVWRRLNSWEHSLSRRSTITSSGVSTACQAVEERRVLLVHMVLLVYM